MADNKWERFAETFEKKNNYVAGIKNIQSVKDALSAISDLGRVLELGCGNGTYTDCLLANASSVVATDISEAMLQVVKEKFKSDKKIRLEKANCFDLPYEKYSFDTVFMANLLHVIPNRARALLECYRVIKPGGRLVVVDFTQYKTRLFDRIRLKYRYIKTYGLKTASNITLIPQWAADMLAGVGFQILSIEMIGLSVKAVYIIAERAKTPFD